MGKIDDMRRQREQQFADAAQREAKAAKAAPASPASPASPPVAPSAPAPVAKPAPRGEVTTTSSKRGASGKSAGDEQGKCPDCGKTKPLSNGLMASHQKGFGKACTGSRKPPM